MHFSELLDWKEFEENGWQEQRLVVNRGLVTRSLTGYGDGPDSLEVFEAVIGLLQDQVHKKALDNHSHLVSSPDLRFLFEAYTKLGLKLRIDVPRMPYRDWESFDRLTGVPTEQWERLQIAEAQARWYEAAAQQVSELMVERWNAELFSSVDLSMTSEWPNVVASIESLQRTFRSAQDEDDYNNVGRGSLSLLQKLGDVLWENGNYTNRAGTPDSTKTFKNRLTTVATAEFGGAENEAIRGLVLKAIDYANAVKHRNTPTRDDAAISADAAIFLVSIFWRALGSRYVVGPATNVADLGLSEPYGDLDDVPF